MKKINFRLDPYFLNLILILFLITGCFNDKFKYSGEYPDREYLNLYNAEKIGEIKPVDEKMVSYRNRIYLTVDLSLQVYLNNYPINMETFAEDFKYIYTNPDRLRHLPESPEKVVVFYATDVSANILKSSGSTMEQEKRLLEVNQIQSRLRAIIQQLRESYFQQNFGMPLFGAVDSQLIKVEKMFPLNLAIYSNTFSPNDNRGITAKLPPWAEESGKFKERNVISIIVKKKNELFLRDKPFEVENLKDTVKAMILNQFQNPAYPEGPRKAIVSLQNDRGTDYKVYSKVYTAITNAYDELREEQAQLIFGKSYASLNKTERKTVTQKIPFTLSESEPTAFDE